MIKKHIALILLAFSVLWITSCTLKEASEETPYPSESRIEKTFFEGKTFLAGWSPVTTAGGPNEVLLTHLNQTGHVNIEFEVTESQLIGRAVSPSNPNKKSWKTVITIPIVKHYYLEKQKDARGRDTNQWIENTSRSHFSARPYMDLDFSRIQIKDWSMAMFWQGHQVDNVFDIEWDKQKNFLGFTLSVTSAGVFANGSPQQGDFRFNFLPFEHDKSFPVTPYALSSAKHLNVLHVLGKYQNDDPKNPIFYGSKWDTRKGKKHTFHLFGFPEEHLAIAEDVVRLWNDAFERIGQGRPFETQIGEGEYAFDIRKSAIIWIDDPKLSQNSPLGVGQAITDVRNGKILWGKVTIWGGRLTELINSYSPNGGGTSDAKSSVQLSLMMNDQITQSAEKVFPPELQSLTSFQTVKEGLTASIGSQASGLNSLVQSMRSSNISQLYKKSSSQQLLFDPLRSWMDSLPNGQMSAQSQQDFKNLIQNQLASTQGQLQNQDLINQLANEAVLATSSLRLSEDAHRKLFSADQLQKLIGMPTLAESIEQVPIQNHQSKKALFQQRSISKNALIDAIGKDIQTSSTSQGVFDMDRTVQEVAGSWSMALVQNQQVDKSKALRSLIKDLLLHEVGHVIGLGHNFKENILPEDGTLPDHSKYYLDSKDHKESQLFSPNSLKRIAEKDQTNYTSVMGYKNGVTDILTRYEDLMPGPSDLLVLEYLYNRKYPVYSRENKGAGDFQMIPIPTDGQLYEQVRFKNDSNKVHEIAYYPSCNDFSASYATDPYCARWDKGYDAPTLVDNYFNEYNANLISQLSSFSNSYKGGAFWAYEGYIWRRSLGTFGRARLFYDYMRQKFEKELNEMIESNTEESTQALLDFSQVCRDIYENKKPEGSQRAIDVLSNPKNEELVKLCVANSRTMNELESLLQLPGKDFSELNYDEKYFSFVQGGQISTSLNRAFGSWKELARLPIKISALLALTTSQPFISLGGWAWPIPQYSRPDANYHMSTFYPKEYTSAIASGAEMNLNLSGSTAEEYSSIGKTVLAMGYMLQNQRMSNDSLRVNSPFIQNLRRQTNYRFSTVIIQVNRKREDGKEIAKKFTGTIHNFFQRGPETLPEIYLYTNDRTVIIPPTQSLLLPLSSIRWYGRDDGYYYALKMDFDDDDEFDRLKTKNVRKALESNYYQIMKKCVEGDHSNGLRYYFNDLPDSVFSGFTFSDNIFENQEDRRQLTRSVQDHFKNYYNNKKSNQTEMFSVAPNPKHCEEAMKGQGLIVMAASVLNGYYFADLFDYLEKGN